MGIENRSEQSPRVPINLPILVTDIVTASADKLQTDIQPACERIFVNSQEPIRLLQLSSLATNNRLVTALNANGLTLSEKDKEAVTLDQQKLVYGIVLLSAYYAAQQQGVIPALFPEIPDTASVQRLRDFPRFMRDAITARRQFYQELREHPLVVNSTRRARVFKRDPKEEDLLRSQPFRDAVAKDITLAKMTTNWGELFTDNGSDMSLKDGIMYLLQRTDNNIRGTSMVRSARRYKRGYAEELEKMKRTDPQRRERVLKDIRDSMNMLRHSTLQILGFPDTKDDRGHDAPLPLPPADGGTYSVVAEAEDVVRGIFYKKSVDVF